MLDGPKIWKNVGKNWQIAPKNETGKFFPKIREPLSTPRVFMGHEEFVLKNNSVIILQNYRQPANIW